MLKNQYADWLLKVNFKLALSNLKLFFFKSIFWVINLKTNLTLGESSRTLTPRSQSASPKRKTKTFEFTEKQIQYSPIKFDQVDTTKASFFSQTEVNYFKHGFNLNLLYKTVLF